MDTDKRLQHLTERLTYMKDVFVEKHKEDLSLLAVRLDELKKAQGKSTQEQMREGLSTLEDLFFFMECKLEDKLSPMDKVRIVRHPQRICLRDILENVYDNYTEIGGNDEHTNDPAMLIARAYISRQRGKKIYNQPVLVIGHEKGHGEEFRNGGSAKPWGNAKALHYMKVAETEGIPVHSYVFTPGGFPVEDYPGAAQQIAKNIYEMAGLSVPVVAVFSEGGSGGAEAISLSDKRIMLSHGYYSVISPEGAAAIEGRLKGKQKANAELLERCAAQACMTAEDNLRFGYVDRVLQEPVLGAKTFHYEFFRSLRQEVIRATDEVVLSVRRFSPLRGTALRRLRDREINLDNMYVRWDLSMESRKRLVKKRQAKFLKASRSACLDKRSLWRRIKGRINERWWEMCNHLLYDFYHRKKRGWANVLEEVSGEMEMLSMRLTSPWRKLRKRFHKESANLEASDLTKLSDWDESGWRNGDWVWISEKAKVDRAVTCPNAPVHGCLDLWAPDLYNEFAGVCTNCGHHFPMEYQWLMYNCLDQGSLFEFNGELEAGNPLNFPGFDQRLEEARKKTGLKSACLTFEARVDGTQVVLAILVAPFRGGSVGAAEGAKFVAAAERARRKRYPFLVYSHGTAGIRIQEGIHGLIQMPRCTVAVRRYIEAGGLYMVLYDTKSYGGPVASFLGCSSYQFAIRSSDLGFAGPAVIKETANIDLPPHYHNCYQALARGHIQGVWDRRDVRNNLKQALMTMGGRNLYYR